MRDVVDTAKHAPELDITVAGTGRLQGYVESAARSLTNLRYQGFLHRADGKRLVRGARVIVVPSRWAEPAGLVALEAMAAGTPVVAYPNGGLTEYVSNTGGGVLVAEEPRSLAEAAAHVSADRQLWDTLSSRGFEGVRRLHSPERHMERIEAIFAEVACRAAP